MFTPTAFLSLRFYLLEVFLMGLFNNLKELEVELVRPVFLETVFSAEIHTLIKPWHSSITFFFILLVPITLLSFSRIPFTCSTIKIWHWIHSLHVEIVRGYDRLCIVRKPLSAEIMTVKISERPLGYKIKDWSRYNRNLKFISWKLFLMVQIKHDLDAKRGVTVGKIIIC